MFIYTVLQAYSPLGSSEKNLAHDPVVEKVPEQTFFLLKLSISFMYNDPNSNPK
jgi:hypothetical protein